MKMMLPANSMEDIEKCLKIRYESFVIEKNVPQSIEVDAKDVPGSDCMHFLIYEDEKPVGTFRVSINQNHVAKLQRFCVLKDYRSMGYGSFAMEFLEGFCIGQGVKKIVFDAQCTAVAFYEKHSYTVFSEEFEEAGMMHVKMMKKLILEDE